MTAALRSAQHRIGEQSAQIRQLSTELEQVRAALDAMTKSKDTAQAFLEDYSRDLGIACADLRALHEQHDAAAAERDQLRSRAQALESDIEMLQRKLHAATEAHAQAVAQLAELTAEVEELRIEVQRDGERRGILGLGRTRDGRRGVPSAAAHPKTIKTVETVGPVEPVDEALNRRLSGEFQA